MSDAVAEFASVSDVFRRWALQPHEADVHAARAALSVIASLYAAGLRLLPLPILAEDDGLREPAVSDADLQVVRRNASDLPVSVYWEIFNPLGDQPEDPVAGCLADDIGDIYNDVVAGLLLFQGGRYLEAHWQWVASLHHWGEHATSATRALHMYIADDNAFTD